MDFDECLEMKVKCHDLVHVVRKGNCNGAKDVEVRREGDFNKVQERC